MGLRVKKCKEVHFVTGKTDQVGLYSLKTQRVYFLSCYKVKKLAMFK
jgi:hypothetical protein